MALEPVSSRVFCREELDLNLMVQHRLQMAGRDRAQNGKKHTHGPVHNNPVDFDCLHRCRPIGLVLLEL